MHCRVAQVVYQYHPVSPHRNTACPFKRIATVSQRYSPSTTKETINCSQYVRRQDSENQVQVLRQNEKCESCIYMNDKWPNNNGDRAASQRAVPLRVTLSISTVPVHPLNRILSLVGI